MIVGPHSFQFISVPSGSSTVFVLSYDGSDDYCRIDFDSSDPLNVTDEWTLEIWLCPEDHNGYERVISRGGINEEIEVLNNNGGGDYWLRINGSDRHRDQTTAFPLNEWHHLAVTYSQSNSRTRFYFDGTLSDEEGSPSTPNTGRNYWRLAQNTGSDIYQGKQYDFRIWSVERTQQQINDNKDVRLDGSEAGLVGYWKIDEGSGTTIFDSASTNDGNINGATWVEK